MASVVPSTGFVFVLEPKSEAGANMPIHVARKIRKSIESKCSECRRWNIYGRDRIQLLADVHCPTDAVAVESVTGVCLVDPRLHEVLSPFSREGETAEIRCKIQGKYVTRIAWSVLRDRRAEVVYPYWTPCRRCALCGRYTETPNQNATPAAIQRIFAGGELFQDECGFIIVSEKLCSEIKNRQVSGIRLKKVPIVESVSVEMHDGSIEVIQ